MQRKWIVIAAALAALPAGLAAQGRPRPPKLPSAWAYAAGDNRGRIGVVVRTDADPETDKIGARIEGVTPGGPADKAGLKVGDIITKFNGTSLAGAKAEDEEESGPGSKLIELARKLDELRSRPRLLLVFGLRPRERRPVELGDNVADLEPGLVGGAPRRHALDLGADLVGLGVRVGPHDHADAAAIVGDRVGEHARRPRSTGRLLGHEPARPRGERRRGHHDPLPLHGQYPPGPHSPT